MQAVAVACGQAAGGMRDYQRPGAGRCRLCTAGSARNNGPRTVVRLLRSGHLLPAPCARAGRGTLRAGRQRWRAPVGRDALARASTAAIVIDAAALLLSAPHAGAREGGWRTLAHAGARWPNHAGAPRRAACSPSLGRAVAPWRVRRDAAPRREPCICAWRASCRPPLARRARPHATLDTACTVHIDIRPPCPAPTPSPSS
jgi:hypothetical protein